MSIEVVTRKSLSQPQDMPSPWVEEPCHDAVRSKNCTTMLAMEVDFMCHHRNKRHCHKVYVHCEGVLSLLAKPIPSDTFKTHILSLGMRKVQFRGISCHVMDKVLLQ